MTEVDTPSPIDLDTILDSIDASAYTIPGIHETRIFKDECMYCYKTPFFPNGLFICLKTFAAFCESHLKHVAEESNRVIYLQITSRKNETEESDEPKDKIKRLAIGVDAGFCNEKVEVEDEYHLVVYPRIDQRVPLNLIANYPIGSACQRIATTTSAERIELLQGASNAWDGELKQVTKHADLTQIENPRKLACSDWKCDVDSCDLKENLWLNLHDGAIRCGRSQLIGDGLRSKGNNHMKMYYDDKHHPLVVKLGTIEENGAADVYSYDEDDSVIDPNLEKHLAHFGLNMKELQKTEKSTIELELDINQKWEWAKCQEDGENLELAYGPLYTGMINIGSSCYLNSVIQSLLCVPSFLDTFSNNALKIFGTMDAPEVNESVIGQCAKLFSSLASGEFSQPPPKDKLNGVKPTQFRRVVGKGHVEFSTAKQQDAEEYVRHLIDKITSLLPSEFSDPTVALRFKMQSRLTDLATRRVRYNDKEEYVLSVPIPAISLAPVDNEGIRMSIGLKDCLSAAFAEEVIEGFKSPVTGEVLGATRNDKMATFPDFLFIQVKRFKVGEDYSLSKMDVDVLVDEEIDLAPFRGNGKQPDEELLPEDEESVVPAFEVNEGFVRELESMGFSRNAAMKACIETKNSTLENATEWVMNKIGDPTLDAPPEAPKKNTSSSSSSPSESETQLINLGFTLHQAKFALLRERDVNAAAEWLFGHSDEVPEEVVEVRKEKQYHDGSSRYRLVSFVSHMGSTPHSGHYVCHVKRDGRWVLFNDDKVAFSKAPPKHLAYLYLYQRI